MKKIVLLITILFVSVLTTACINNLAVQELNNKAKEYMSNGETEKAICRLKSSLDLDSNMYETHYNLAIAFIANKEYGEAIKSLETVLKLKPDFTDTYYSLGVAYEEEAFTVINGEDKKDKDEDKENETAETSKKLSAEETGKVCDLFTKSIENYNNYLTKKVDAQDKDKVNERINYLNAELRKYNLSETQAPQEN